MVYPSVEYAGKQIQAGIFQPLDKSKAAQPQEHRPGDSQGAPGGRPRQQVPGALHVVLHRRGDQRDKVSKALGGKLPDNAWDLLFDPKVTDKLKDCGISMMDEASDLVPAAMLYAGKDTAKMATADIRAAVEHVTPARKNVRTFNSRRST